MNLNDNCKRCRFCKQCLEFDLADYPIIMESPDVDPHIKVCISFRVWPPAIGWRPYVREGLE